MRVRMPTMKLRPGMTALLGALLCAAFFASSCGDGEQSERGGGLPDGFDPDSVPIDRSAKEDSPSHPSEMGELQLCRDAEGRLASSSGYHLYTFEGRRGWAVQFTLNTTDNNERSDFFPYLRITSPSGQTRSDTEPQHSQLVGVWRVRVNWELPEDGTYEVLATSTSNMGVLAGVLGEYWRSDGKYRLYAQSRLTCGGPGSTGCPAYLECHTNWACRQPEGVESCSDACDPPCQRYEVTTGCADCRPGGDCDPVMCRPF